MTHPLPRLPPRKHCLLIILWAEGHPVQFRTPDNTWCETLTPQWNPESTYSILLSKYRLTSGPTGVILDPLATITHPRS